MKKCRMSQMAGCMIGFELELQHIRGKCVLVGVLVVALRMLRGRVERTKVRSLPGGRGRDGVESMFFL